MFSLIAASLAAGYVCRRLGMLGERTARWVMTAVAAFGYSTVGLLSIWVTPLSPADAWLPAIGALQMLVFAAAGLAAGGALTRDRGERGLLGIACSISNNGLTMGGFVIYLLYGQAGLGLANVYSIMFSPMLVLLGYPLARHYAAGGAGPLWRLLLRSLFDWRSIGLPMAIAGVWLSVAAVPRPTVIEHWHVVDVLVYGINIAAYFAIGLRLELSSVRGVWRLIAGLAAVRFVLGWAFGLVCVWLIALSPWPMGPLGSAVLVIQSFVPTAVSMVAIANMFHLRPVQASVLFVANTLMYLVIVLPIVLACRGLLWCPAG